VASEEAKERVIDFSQFRDKTELSSNPTLKANDVVVIPRLPDVKPVFMMGAVQKPGVFTLEKPLPLMESLALAGGLSDDADLKKLSILGEYEGKYSIRNINFESFLTGEDLTANPQVSQGEAVFVPKKLEEKSILVNVVGQVTNPGGVQIPEDGRLFDAIFMAGGFADEAEISKVTITHLQPQSPVKTEANLKNFLITGDLKDNPQLAKGDIVFVPIKEEGAKRIIPPLQAPFFSTISLSVFGEVHQPNTYQVSSDSNLLDILRLAGGPTTDADLKRVMILREKTEKEQRLIVDLEKVLQEGELKLLPPLLTDDTIFVPKVKPSRNIWGIIVKTAADVSTIAIAVLIVTGQRYYR
jgi:protein involved in polysaccharide export with SLBB domain